MRESGRVSARELIFDVYGDYVRYLGGSARLGAISSFLESFDVGAPTVRVTMSRLRADGYFETERLGRETAYVMTEKLTKYLDDGYQRIFQPPIHTWVGRWTMVILQIPESERTHRDHVKRVLEWEGFGQLSPTIWISPRQNREHVERRLAGRGDGHVDVFSMETGSLDRDRELVSRCWDLTALHHWYEDFLERWGPCLGAELHLADPRKALHRRIELMSQYREVLFLDPFLPRALQPEGWLGGRAFQALLTIHDGLAQPAMTAAVALLDGTDAHV